MALLHYKNDIKVKRNEIKINFSPWPSAATATTSLHCIGCIIKNGGSLTTACVYVQDMADNRLPSWKEYDLLIGAMQTYVKEGLKREEVLDFPQYTWTGVSEQWTDVYVILEFITKMTLFRLKTLKTL